MSDRPIYCVLLPPMKANTNKLSVLLGFLTKFLPHCYQTYEYKLYTLTQKQPNQNIFTGYDILIGSFTSMSTGIKL